MSKNRNKIASFKYRPFSRKQKKVLTWWTERSPYKDHDMLIADGAIRSGKTISCIDSFVTWSLSSFENETFIIAGRSMGALKRNVLQPLFQILAAKGWAINIIARKTSLSLAQTLITVLERATKRAKTFCRA